MVFSSPIFLFVFLPLVLTVYLVLPGIRTRNLWLLLTSLVFYAWGQVDFILLLLASTMVNCGLGWWVDRHEDGARRKLAVTVAVAVNIGLLAFFKYADFVVGQLNVVLQFAGFAPVREPHIPLPIGISFFTFHALSYVIDVYRRKWKASADPKDVALYIFFFPQLIAGPILRWSAIGPQLERRAVGMAQMKEGIGRFAGGLGKKVLIANTLALPADQIFALPAGELSMADAWFGIVCYTLQIYFDFSGYSDMAIGMGKMFGFTFLENFQFPYTAQSVRDFWKRWHISLSTWFRDYLYIPLGGSRVSEFRTQLNLLIVFALCGLWHGASFTFLIWGLFHGGFLMLERTRFGALLEKLPRVFRSVYTLLAVMMAWVIFRADTLEAAGRYYQALFVPAQLPAAQPLARYLSSEVICALVAGILFCGPLWGLINIWCARLNHASPSALRPVLQTAGAGLEMALVAGLLLMSFAWLSAGTYNPFIYFRF